VKSARTGERIFHNKSLSFSCTVQTIFIANVTADKSLPLKMLLIALLFFVADHPARIFVMKAKVYF
jgi:hypothetical protein